eukprot:scaffold206461_cov30-Tisochrysis_lutea.AAC.1
MPAMTLPTLRPSRATHLDGSRGRHQRSRAADKLAEIVNDALVVGRVRVPLTARRAAPWWHDVRVLPAEAHRFHRRHVEGSTPDVEDKQRHNHEEEDDAHNEREHQNSSLEGIVGFARKVTQIPQRIGMEHEEADEVETHCGQGGQEEGEEGRLGALAKILREAGIGRECLESRPVGGGGLGSTSGQHGWAGGHCAKVGVDEQRLEYIGRRA